MTYKFCPHCAAKNFFEIQPKFCCSCGQPLNSSTATVSTELDPEVDLPALDIERGGIPRIPKLDVDIEIPQESWEKFGENIGTASDQDYKKQARPEFKKGVPISQVLLEDRKVQKRSIGGDDE